MRAPATQIVRGLRSIALLIFQAETRPEIGSISELIWTLCLPPTT
jgi:hypothetical protein